MSVSQKDPLLKKKKKKGCAYSRGGAYFKIWLIQGALIRGEALIRGLAVAQPRIQGLFSVYKLAGEENPGKNCQNTLKILEHFAAKNMETFFQNNAFRYQKTNTAPIAEKNPRKSHFIVCHVTKYSTILGAF